MLNHCNFIGNLGKDPETRQTSTGETCCNFSIAVSQRWKDKQTDEQSEKTEWINLVVFGKLADICDQYLKKGSKIYASGRMQTRKWQDKEGNDRYSTEIVLEQLEMLDNKDKSSDTTSQYQPAPAQPPQQTYSPVPPPPQPQRPANAQLGNDGITWWIPSPSGWDIWQ